MGKKKKRKEKVSCLPGEKKGGSAIDGVQAVGRKMAYHSKKRREGGGKGEFYL